MSDVVAALQAFEREKKSGVVTVVAESVTTRILLRDGVPVGADGGVLGETLGNVLIREEIISHAHFAAVVRKMTDALIDDENEEDQRFGDVLVELGILTPDGLEKALATQIEKKIIGCVVRAGAEWSFDASGQIGTTSRRESPIRTLLVDAASLLSEERVATTLSLTRETYPVLTQDAPAIATAYGLKDTEVILLPRLDGAHATSSFGDSDLALLCGLVMGGSVELREARAEAPATISEAPAAVGRQRSLRPPPVPMTVDIKMPDVRSASLRPARNDREAALFAEDEFQAGKRLFAEGRLEQAFEQLVLARERSPDITLYALYADFVGSRLKGHFVDLAETKRVAMRMVREDPECAFAHYVLGYIAQEEDAGASAKRFFERAFVLDRNLLDAGRQARKLESRTDCAAASPAVREVVPTRTTGSEPRERSPMSRLTVLLIVLGVLTTITIGYVITARAGMWDDYQEVR